MRMRLTDATILFCIFTHSKPKTAWQTSYGKITYTAEGLTAFS